MNSEKQAGAVLHKPAEIMCMNETWQVLHVALHSVLTVKDLLY